MRVSAQAGQRADACLRRTRTCVSATASVRRAFQDASASLFFVAARASASRTDSDVVAAIAPAPAPASASASAAASVRAKTSEESRCAEFTTLASRPHA